MNFSIVLASRQRMALLEDLLASIAATTHDLANVEVLIGIDHDDEGTCAVQERLSAQFPFAIFHRRHRSRNINNDYLNWLYGFSSGKYIIACNDDAAFRTANWDQIIINKLEQYLSDKNDGIVYGYISDNLPDRHGMSYCCFPLVSRKGAEALGYVLPGCFHGWNADIACWRVYECVGRVCDLSGIIIDHISYHNGTRERDEISHHVEQISKDNNAPSGAEYDLSKDVSRLSVAMGTVTSLPIGKHGIIYSILVPTRERIELLERMIESVANTASNKEQIEIAVAYDTDDRITNSAIARLVRRFGILARFYGRQRSPLLNRDYMNWLYKFSKGTFLIIANDDCMFTTNNWDQIITARLKTYLVDKPDGIVYGKIQDALADHQGLDYSCFPLLSRKAIDLLGYVMHPEIPAPTGADIHLWRIYNAANRVLDFNGITIDHLSSFTGKRDKDHINTYVERVSAGLPFDPRTVDITSEVNKLTAHIQIEPLPPPIIQSPPRKPHLLCVTERWCDGNPHAGATNNEHNLFGSLEVAGVATFDRLHLDEYRLQFGRNADEELLNRCYHARPDVIIACYLFCSDMNIRHETWKQVAEMGIPVVFLWFDLILEDRAHFADTLAPYCRLNVVLDTSNYKTMLSDKYISMWTPQDTRHFFNPHGVRDIPVCFLGSMQGYRDRNLGLTALRHNGIEVFQAGGQREQSIPLEAYVSVLQRSKICLNFPRMRGNVGLIQAKGRIFEATLCGALLMDADNNQTSRWYIPNEEYASFVDERDLVGKVKYYLEHEDERSLVANRGWTKASSSYSAKNFWKTILEKIGVL